MMSKIPVYIIESERGWGQKVDEIKHFDNVQEADDFVAQYNLQNDKDEVPDWYMYATRTLGYGVSIPG